MHDVLILLPPSEGKTAPDGGAPVDLQGLSFPDLNERRAGLLEALAGLCRQDPEHAAKILGLGPTQAGDVSRNATLAQAPAAAAREVYSGVLYDALGLQGLSGDAAGRADRSVVITSGLWGLLRPADRIPAYRLGGGVSLPGVGTLAAHWRSAVGAVLSEAAGDGVVVDLRSTTYDAFWRPGPELASRTVKVRVLHEHDGKRSVVSHHSKATKGRIARCLLEPGERHSGQLPGIPAQVADALGGLGWKVELAEPAGKNRPWTLDVVVTEVATR